MLFVAFDAALPEPLNSKRPMTGAFGAALVLEPAGAAGAIAEIACAPTQAGSDWSATGIAALDTLSAANPAARSLALLQPIARTEARTVTLGVAPGAYYDWSVAPC